MAVNAVDKLQFLSFIMIINEQFLPHEAMLALYMLFLCVYLCVYLSVSKWPNRGSHKQSHAIAQGLEFSSANDYGKI